MAPIPVAPADASLIDSRQAFQRLLVTLGLVVLGTVYCAPLGLPLGIAAWVMGHRDLKKIQANIMDPRGKGPTQAGWICGIIGTILDGLATLGCLVGVGFFIFAINQAKPPAKPAPNPQPKRNFQVPGAPLRLMDYLPVQHRAVYVSRW